jgi:hypothetical protein
MTVDKSKLRLEVSASDFTGVDGRRHMEYSLYLVDDDGDRNYILAKDYIPLTKLVGETNYNDGKWYGWDGGECPVHPETMVETVWVNGDCKKGVASRWKWRVEGQIQYMIAFRVIKEHREPREWWSLWSPSGNLIGNFTKDSAHRKNDTHYNGKGCVIHVREVIE